MKLEMKMYDIKVVILYRCAILRILGGSGEFEAHTTVRVGYVKRCASMFTYAGGILCFTTPWTLALLLHFVTHRTVIDLSGTNEFESCRFICFAMLGVAY